MSLKSYKNVEDGTDSPAVKKQNSNYYRNIGIAAVCAIIIIVIVVTLSVIYSREIEGDKIVYTAPTMSPTTSTIQELSVATSEGKAVGYRNLKGVNVWKNIPYAQPPVRFANPVWPLNYTDGVHNATDQMNLFCIQNYFSPEFTYSEDCLVLNIYAPPVKADKTTLPNGYPVLFFIHGGNFQTGGADYATYEGSNFAQNNVVFVSINYRVGFMGFFAATGLEGNYGLYDQLMALKWVKKNIAQFGGDAAKVTIDGESAGAMSVAMHMASPLSVGLFSGVIMQSTYFYNSFWPDISVVRGRGDTIITQAKAIGSPCEIGDIACLRSLPASSIKAFQEATNKFFTFEPAIGTEIVPLNPMLAFKTGKIQKIPMIIGSNSGEGRSYAFQLFPDAKTKSLFMAGLTSFIGNATAQIIAKAYPTPTDPNFDYRLLLSEVATDLVFYCPLRYAVDNLQKTRKIESSVQPVYNYLYKHVSVSPCHGETYPYCLDIACHAYELPWVFDNLVCEAFDGSKVTSLNATTDERTLSLGIQSAWVNFAYTGNPNDGPMNATVIRPFPLYETTTRPYVKLDYPDSADYSATNHKNEICSSIFDFVYDQVV